MAQWSGTTSRSDGASLQPRSRRTGQQARHGKQQDGHAEQQWHEQQPTDKISIWMSAIKIYTLKAFNRFKRLAAGFIFLSHAAFTLGLTQKGHFRALFVCTQSGLTLLKSRGY